MLQISNMYQSYKVESSSYDLLILSHGCVYPYSLNVVFNFQKTESLYRDSMTIEFGCQSECKPANIETKKMKRKTRCCTTDLCNVNKADEPDNSATSVTSSTFAIVYHVALLGLNILKPF